jgi:hypothetical protein
MTPTPHEEGKEQEIKKVEAQLGVEKNLEKITFYEGYLKGLKYAPPHLVESKPVQVGDVKVTARAIVEGDAVIEALIPCAPHEEGKELLHQLENAFDQYAQFKGSGWSKDARNHKGECKRLIQELRSVFNATHPALKDTIDGLPADKVIAQQQKDNIELNLAVDKAKAEGWREKICTCDKERLNELTHYLNCPVLVVESELAATEKRVRGEIEKEVISQFRMQLQCPKWYSKEQERVWFDAMVSVEGFLQSFLSPTKDT